MSDIALSISILALVAVLGLWIGNWRIYGVGLGIGGVLFGGIFVGHFTGTWGIDLDSNTLHFIQEFGLILFVYTIGIQVGPGFFASLRSSGLKLNGFAALVVLLGCIVTIALHHLFDVPCLLFSASFPARSPIHRHSVPDSKFFQSLVPRKVCWILPVWVMPLPIRSGSAASC